jgi:2-methylcitrate dehydratase PrpD
VVTERLAEHIASALSRPLPPEVALKGRQHILDTIAAMVSGSRLEAGEKAIPYAAATAGRAEATVAGSDISTSIVQAALANGMLAHADETDDSHAPSLTHPGCAVVPAALAVAEARGLSGRDLLNAVVAGYDVGPRISMALGGERFFEQHHSSHAVGGLFGAAGAAGALFALSQPQCRSLLGYAVQMASGNACWRRDPDHVEKAFDFGGMPAMNGVLAAQMVAAGFTGVADALEGTPGLFSAFPQNAQPHLATDGLGATYEIMGTAIKKWCVGSPIQSALDALEFLMKDGIAADDVDRVVVAIPLTSARVVEDRAMPTVNLRHQLALMLADGTVTFATAHDTERMNDARIIALKERIDIDPRTDEDFEIHRRQAIVQVRTQRGAALEKKVRHVRGTPANPMETDEIIAKALDLMAPILGPVAARDLIHRVMNIESETDIRLMTPLLRARPSTR